MLMLTDYKQKETRLCVLGTKGFKIGRFLQNAQFESRQRLALVYEHPGIIRIFNSPSSSFTLTHDLFHFLSLSRSILLSRSYSFVIFFSQISLFFFVYLSFSTQNSVTVDSRILQCHITARKLTEYFLNFVFCVSYLVFSIGESFPNDLFICSFIHPSQPSSARSYSVC